MIRALAQQGEFGPTEDVERTVTDVTRRILKPGGMMILVVATARRLREADYIPVDVARRAYDPAQLRGMVSDAGFLPLKCEGLMRKRMPGRDRYFALAAIK